MKFFRRNQPSRVIVIALIALVSVGAGFLFDAVCTAVEKRMYPIRYETFVLTSSERFGVPPEVAFAVIRTESGFDSGAASPAGAVGLMQLMPDTFRFLSDDILCEHLEDGMRYDPETNIRYGICLLGRLFDRYGNWDTALAAYNAGEGRVDEWLSDPACTDQDGHMKHIPFKETRHYVKKVSDACDMYERLYGKRFPDVETSSAPDTDEGMKDHRPTVG